MTIKDALDTSLLQTIISRRSIRRYSPQPVSRALLAHLLTAAVWAPSAHNRQPWRFAVIYSDAYKQQLARAMGERLKTDLQADGVPLEVIERDVTRSYERITSAPVLVLVCLSMADMDTYTDEQRNHNEYVMAVQSVAMAAQNLLLAAHERGLGACWMCAPLFVPNVVRRVLHLPDDWQPQGLITLGYPAEQRERSRRPIEESVIWL